MAIETFDLPNPGTLPEVPRSYHRRVVRERDAKELCVTWGTAAAKEFVDKSQILWPTGALNPIPAYNADAVHNERFTLNRREAAAQLANSIKFHPGFRDVSDA